MHDFAYLRPASLEQALAALGPSAMPMAGTTELLNWLRLGISQPASLVDITKLDGMRGIAQAGDDIVIGALSTLNEVGAHPLVREHATTLGDACLKAASAQIRNRATLGGNLLQKTRCSYFRAEAPLPWGCNKRSPGSGCAAREGVNDQHAIFGWTDACVATQPSDPAVALACLDAVVEVLGPRGARTLAVREFHLTPAEADPVTETRLRPDELIVRYRIPIQRGARSAYLKIRERESYAYATVAAAAAVEMDGDRIARARIALGSVAARPWRLSKTEAALVGRRLDPVELKSAVDLVLAEARPLTHNAYKITIARNAAVRVLLMAGGSA